MRDSDWKSIALLKEPFNDALNYKSRKEKESLNEFFLRTEELDKCLAPSTYFLMGEKGTGKTAYAVYLENNSINGFRCQTTTMTETQYKRFIELRKQGKLSYSDFANIWRSMLLFLVGRMVVHKSKSLVHHITGKFSKLESEIKKWSRNALNPEIESAFEAVISESLNAKLTAKEIGEAGAEKKTQNTEKIPQIRHHLLETENGLKEAISSLTLADGHILFLDGIDYRPESVPYADYIECVKGLGEAVWQLNTEFFGSIRDSRGRIKVMLLVRPDVFHALNLYNSNSRLQDNTVFLDWTTNEREYRNSRLYELSGKYFSTQQISGVDPKEAWEHYYDEVKTNGAIFRRLLRSTFQKPRDILTFVRMTRQAVLNSGVGASSVFPPDVTSSSALSRNFSDYLLGEVRNYASFYMTQIDFTQYMKFFQFLNGKSRFNFSDFELVFNKFKEWSDGETIKARDFLRDPEALLQFFYDVNVIGYSEMVSGGPNTGQAFHHWSYRERSLNNIAPKVKTAEMFILNSGIAKALDIGLASRNDGQSKNRRRPRPAPKKQSTRRRVG
jgi:hypothetical protein